MATRQYIGARYVPKFFSGEGGSTDWVSGIPYEALTIVTYLGNSFTSKKPVPVGIDILNTEYWVATGTYNSQIEALSEKVDEYKDKVESVVTPANMNQIICISDSYGSLTPNWCNGLMDKLGVDGHIRAEGSAGFVQTGLSGNTFGTLLSTLVSGLTSAEKNAITHVIVCGGSNDSLHTKSDIETAIANFISYVDENLPNAIVMIGMIGRTSDPTKILSYVPVLEAYQNCIYYGGLYLNGVQEILQDYSLLDADKVHPNQYGTNALVGGIYEAIMRGSCEKSFATNDVTVTGTNRTITGGKIFASVNKGMYSIGSNIKWGVGFTDSPSVVCDGGHSVYICNIPSSIKYIVGNYYEKCGTQITTYVFDGTNYNEVSGFIYVYDGKIYFRPMKVTSNTHPTISFVEMILTEFNIVGNAMEV